MLHAPLPFANCWVGFGLRCGWVGVWGWRVSGFGLRCVGVWVGGCVEGWGVCVGLEQKPFSPGFHLFTLDPHGGYGVGWRVSGFGLRCVGLWVGGCVEGWGYRWLRWVGTETSVTLDPHGGFGLGCVGRVGLEQKLTLVPRGRL